MNFELLTFPCREMIKLSIHMLRMEAFVSRAAGGSISAFFSRRETTCFQNESISIQKTHLLV